MHADFFEEYLYNLQCLVDLPSIDYIVMNHTEPDHSGSLQKLLELCPNSTVVCTAAAQKYLKGITNRDFPCRVVKHGDTLDIGGLSLEFVVAPLLHWPDSMMTYLREDSVLFSCDFLGCHYCEPSMLDENVRYKDAYLGEFAYYYQGIFGPFKPYVLAGLDQNRRLGSGSCLSQPRPCFGGGDGNAWRITGNGARCPAGPKRRLFYMLPLTSVPSFWRKPLAGPSMTGRR